MKRTILKTFKFNFLNLTKGTGEDLEKAEEKANGFNKERDGIIKQFEILHATEDQLGSLTVLIEYDEYKGED